MATQPVLPEYTKKSESTAQLGYDDQSKLNEQLLEIVKQCELSKLPESEQQTRGSIQPALDTQITGHTIGENREAANRRIAIMVWPLCICASCCSIALMGACVFGIIPLFLASK